MAARLYLITPPALDPPVFAERLKEALDAGDVASLQLRLKDVESALVAYFEEQHRRDSLVHKVEADRRTLEITEDLYQVGLANETQVLEARKTRINSESSLIESEQALAGDLVALYKAIGGDWD